jgi:acetyl-CoA carboxylase carboxyltransferase component
MPTVAASREGDPRLDRLEGMRAQACLGGGSARVERQHARGKMTARERLDHLLDPGTFFELDEFVAHRATGFGLEERRTLGDSVVTGCGEIDGRPVYVFAQDFTVLGGPPPRPQDLQGARPGAGERRAHRRAQ